MRILVVGMGSRGGLGRYEQLLQAALEELELREALEWRGVWRRPHPDYLTHADAAPRASRASAVGFATSIIATARGWHPDLIYFTHVNSARIGPFLRGLGVSAPYVVGALGVEVWSRLNRAKRLALTRAAGVLAISEYTRRRLIDVQHLSAQRCETVHLALEPHWVTSADAVRAERTGEPNGTGFSLLSVCRLEGVARDKGVDWVLRALADVAPRHPQVRYTIVGDGDDLPYLKRLTLDLRLTDRVTFTGELDHASLLHAYDSSDAFILPTRREGFGLVFLEAMAFRLPIIALACAGTLDVVANNEHGLLVEKQAELPAAIERLITDRTYATALGVNGRRAVMSAFSFPEYVSRLWTALTSVSGTKNGEL